MKRKRATAAREGSQWLRSGCGAASVQAQFAGTVVRADAIERVLRDEAGKLSLALRGRAEVLGVGRVYGGLFRGM